LGLALTCQWIAGRSGELGRGRPFREILAGSGEEAIFGKTVFAED